MSTTETKGSADLLVELCKQLNMRKYLKRQILDIRIKMQSLPKFRDSKVKALSALAPEESLLTNEINALRKHLHVIALRILRKNNLTEKDIKKEDFELGPMNLVEGNCELLSADGTKTFLLCIAEGIILPYNTKEEKSDAVSSQFARTQVSGLFDFTQFIGKIPPF